MFNQNSFIWRWRSERIVAISQFTFYEI
jgi:hypothetical protein